MQQAYFDTYAPSYDEDFTVSAIGLAQRARVHRELKHAGDKRENVLEINAGTGEDALFLSERFSKVLVTDVSHAMLEVSRKKLSQHQNVSFAHLDLSRPALGHSEKFELVFSNFGGLNCLKQEELKALSAFFHGIQEKDQELFFVVMGRECIWERLYFKLKGENEKSLRRKQPNGAKAVIGNQEFTTWYYSPHELKEVFASHYEVMKTLPVGFFIPPSFLNNFFKTRKWLLSLFIFMDKRIENVSFLSNYADHYIIRLKRK